MMCLLSAPSHDPECQILFLIKETENVDEDEDENDEDVDLDDENGVDVYDENDEDDENDVDVDDENDDESDEDDENPPTLYFCKPDNDSGRITVTLMANEFPIMFGGYLDMNRFEKYIIQSSNASDDMLFYVHLYFNGKDHAMPYHFQYSKAAKPNRAFLGAFLISADSVFSAERWSWKKTTMLNLLILPNTLGFLFVMLPPLPAKCDILNCLLSAPPHDPECQVIFQIETTLDDDDTNEDEDEHENDNSDEHENDNSDENSDGDENSDADGDADSINEDENDDDDEDENENLLTFYFCKPGYNEEFHKQDVQSIIGDWRLGIWTVFKRKFYILIGMQNILTCLDIDNDSGRITATPMDNESPDLLKSYHPFYKDYLIQSSSNDMLLYIHLIGNGREFEMPYHFQWSNTIRILVATDCHLGYMEKDEVRRHDSFQAFEEICSIAEKKQVRSCWLFLIAMMSGGDKMGACCDFVLLGGDLFHENKPSRATLVKAIEILRRYCLNDQPVQFQVVSDQTVNFANLFGHVNYEDPHFNVGLPVFSIYGNHDDPAGVDNLSAVDILSACNLVNYFGKMDLGGSGVGQIALHPILIRKVCLWISSIRGFCV
ncbi:uncharacterized protein [Solanum tuberosum]|uniref:uncharacterized protein n=1 Tax=Solanum tuberosum TaxID=4113 RepID=UPI00073A2ED8|nr:PREDICTED: uncharacterized protein LOC107059491 [Solanum tuberosum]